MNWLNVFKPNDMTLKNKLIFSALIPLVCVAVVGVTATQKVNALHETTSWVEHTHEAVKMAQHIQGDIVDLETGVRGYLISGKEEFLEPFHAGKESLNKAYAAAREHVSDNPTQLKRISEIEALVNGWLKDAAGPAMAKRRATNEGAEIVKKFKKIQARTIGKEIFDELRGVLTDTDAALKAGGYEEARVILTHVLLDMVNMETGQRGFLLTGKEASLEPFKAGQSALQGHLAQLKIFTQTWKLSAIEARVKRLETLSARWISEAATPEIEARRAVNAVKTTMEDVAAVVESGVGKGYMDKIRTLVADFQGAEEKLLGPRRQSADDDASMTTKVVTIGSLLSALLLILAMWLLNRMVALPIARIAERMEVIAQGDLTQRVEVNGTDEIGQFSLTFNTFVAKFQVAVQEIAANAGQLASAATQMTSVSAAMASNANATMMEVETASGSAQIVNASVQSVAGATEEMSASIGEVARHATQGAQIASDATREATSTNATVRRLGEASAEISEVTQLISSIADQTNLLALNATIEAARAGEAGRGFGVVADEVKALADQTRTATADIAKKVQAIQGEADSAIASIGNISTVIGRIDEITSVIASGIEEQRVTTVEMSDRLTEAAMASAEIGGRFESVTHAATGTNQGASESQATASELAAMASTLEALVNQFKYD